MDRAHSLQCIRSSLDVMKEKKCPTCNEPASEGSIRRNRALEEITEAWDESRWGTLHQGEIIADGDTRPTLIQLATPPVTARRRPPPEPNSKASSSTSGAGVKRPRRDSPSRSNSPAKARQRPDEPVDVPDSDGIELVGEESAALEQELTESGQCLAQCSS